MISINFNPRFPEHVAKEHQCEWCKEMIQIAEPAAKATKIIDNHYFAAYLHPECYAVVCSIHPGNVENYIGTYKRGSMEEK